MIDAIEPDFAKALSLVTEMMAIPGKSGEESEIIRFIVERLKSAGLPDSAIKTDTAHRKSPFGGETGNLVVKLPGTIRGPRRMLMAHIDTVPICVRCKPYRDGDRIRSSDPNTGLGADDRAGAAVVLTAALEILQRQLPHPPLTLFWPVQEEVGLQGARNVTLGALGKPKLAFNFDGGAANKLTIGATGCYRLEIEVSGVAAHAGVAPENGVSAITIASAAIAKLHEEGWLGKIEKGKRTGTSNVGVIEAGQATNVITPKARLLAEVRSHNSTFRKKILDTFCKTFQQAAKSIRNEQGATGDVTFQTRLDYESYKLGRTEPCVVKAAAVIKSLDIAPVYAIADGGLDPNWMFAHGIPTVSMGAGQENIHTVNESLYIDEFETACRIGLRLATDID